MNTRKGFTLVELLVVIAILAILATVSVVGYTSFIGQADKTALDADAKNIESVIEADLALYGKCEVADGVFFVIKNGTIGAYSDAAGTTALAANTVITTFKHAQLTQFNAKIANGSTGTYTIKVNGNVITVSSSKLEASQAATITLN